jgi:hypothetical protein
MVTVICAAVSLISKHSQPSVFNTVLQMLPDKAFAGRGRLQGLPIQRALAVVEISQLFPIWHWPRMQATIGTDLLSQCLQAAVARVMPLFVTLSFCLARRIRCLSFQSCCLSFPRLSLLSHNWIRDSMLERQSAFHAPQSRGSSCAMMSANIVLASASSLAARPTSSARLPCMLSTSPSRF